MVNILSYGPMKVWKGQEILDWIDENWEGSRSRAARDLSKATIYPDRLYTLGKEWANRDRWKWVVRRYDKLRICPYM